MPLTPEEFDVLSRHDLLTFSHRCFLGLNMGPELVPGRHHQMVASALEEVRRGNLRRLIINLPPRHLKSLFASIALPAWWLGHDPSAQILCVSYAQALADKLARECRSVMQAPWYQNVLPTRLSARKQSVEEFETTAGGVRLATSVGGVLTGRGADLIIIDDPQRPDEVISEVQRRNTAEWFSNTLYSRLNDKRVGAIVIIMQRLHEADLAGHVQEQEAWNVMRLPAIAEKDENYQVQTALGTVRYRRSIGEALDPMREPLSVLDNIRRTIGEYNFAGQYQQAPAPQSGGMIKRDLFMTYRPADVPAPAQIVQSWDTASKANDFADYSVCTTWAIVSQKAFLMHVLRSRLDYPDLKRAAREQQRLHGASVVLIEDKGSGIQLAQELLYEGMYAVKRIARPGDLFQLGPHLVACGDARDGELLVRLLGHDRVRIVLTDVPYNVRIRGHVTGGDHREFAMASGEMSRDAFRTFNAAWMEAAARYLMDGGVLGTFIDWRGYPTVQAAAEACGPDPLNLVVWAKTNAGMGSLYRSAHELLPLFRKGKGPHLNNVELGRHGRWRSNVWTYPGASSMGSDARQGLKAHPTVKPTSMLEDALLDLTGRGEIVLDPFLGSGSTLIAAERAGRVCRGIELDPLYVDVVLRRFEAERGRAATKIEG